MIPFQLIQLTDGTTTLTLNDTISYGVIDYAPAIAPRNRSQIGGNAPYEAVQEGNLTVRCVGDTAQGAIANLLKLWQLLDRSSRWYYGENTPPVRLRILEQCSALTQPISALIWIEAGQAPFDLDPNYDQAIGKWTIAGISLHFMRMGQWQGDALMSAASGAVAAGLAMTPTFTAPGTVPMPTRVRIAPSVPASLTAFPAGLIALTNDARYVRPDTTFSGGTVSGDTSALSGSFQRYTAAAGATVTTQTQWNAGGFAGAFADVWLVLRNPSTSNWRVAASIIRSGPVVTLNTVTVDITSANPQIVYLGAGATDSTTTIQLALALTNLGAASASFDLNYAIIVARRPIIGASFNITQLVPLATTIAVDAVAVAPAVAGFGYVVDPWCLNRGGITPLAQDRPSPSVYVGQNFDNYGASWRGDAYATTLGTLPTAFLFATDGANWRPMSGGVPVTWTATMERRETYLTPQ